jgi:hypothetical protein
MTPMGNAGFYAGPQMGQLPPGYVKTVSWPKRKN